MIVVQFFKDRHYFDKEWGNYFKVQSFPFFGVYFFLFDNTHLIFTIIFVSLGSRGGKAGGFGGNPC